MTIKRKPLEDAVEELEKNFDSIYTVGEWARHMGYNRSYFSRKINDINGSPPKELIKELTLEKIERTILDKPEAIGYVVAKETGFKNEKSLHKFLAGHFNTTFGELRQQLIS